MLVKSLTPWPERLRKVITKTQVEMRASQNRLAALSANLRQIPGFRLRAQTQR